MWKIWKDIKNLFMQQKQLFNINLKVWLIVFDAALFQLHTIPWPRLWSKKGTLKSLACCRPNIWRTLSPPGNASGVVTAKIFACYLGKLVLLLLLCTWMFLWHQNWGCTACDYSQLNFFQWCNCNLRILFHWHKVVGKLPLLLHFLLFSESQVKMYLSYWWSTVFLKKKRMSFRIFFISLYFNPWLPNSCMKIH